MLNYVLAGLGSAIGGISRYGASMPLAMPLSIWFRVSRRFGWDTRLRNSSTQRKESE